MLLTVDSDKAVILAVHGCLATAGLQSNATWCAAVKQVRLVCLCLQVLQSLHTIVLLQCNAANALDTQSQIVVANQHLQLPIQQACSTLLNSSMLLITLALLHCLAAVCSPLLPSICCMYNMIANTVVSLPQLLPQLLCCLGTFLLHPYYALELFPPGL